MTSPGDEAADGLFQGKLPRRASRVIYAGYAYPLLRFLQDQADKGFVIDLSDEELSNAVGCHKSHLRRLLLRLERSNPPLIRRSPDPRPGKRRVIELVGRIQEPDELRPPPTDVNESARIDARLSAHLASTEAPVATENARSSAHSPTDAYPSARINARSSAHFRGIAGRIGPENARSSAHVSAGVNASDTTVRNAGAPARINVNVREENNVNVASSIDSTTEQKRPDLDRRRLARAAELLDQVRELGYRPMLQQNGQPRLAGHEPHGERDPAVPWEELAAFKPEIIALLSTEPRVVDRPPTLGAEKMTQLFALIYDDGSDAAKAEAVHRLIDEFDDAKSERFFRRTMEELAVGVLSLADVVDGYEQTLGYEDPAKKARVFSAWIRDHRRLDGARRPAAGPTLRSSPGGGRHEACTPLPIQRP